MLVGEEMRTLDSYVLLNFKWIYYITDDIDFYINGKNVGGESYETPPQREIHTEAMPNRGSALLFGLLWRWGL